MSWLTPVFVVAILSTGVMRLVELAVSRKRMAERPDAVVAEPALFPAMAALHTALIALPLLEVFVWGTQPSLGVACLSICMLLGATALRYWALSTLGKSWNVQVVEPPKVVTTGPYAFIRHPNYLVVILEIAALPLLHAAWISCVVLSLWNAAVLVVRIRNEEAMLMNIEEYAAAMRDRARLIPFVW